MKKSDALQRWCPMARVITSVQNQPTDSGSYSNTANTANKVAITNIPPTVAMTSYNRNGSDFGDVPPGTKCVADRCAMWRQFLQDPDDGYCGLAGVAAHGG